MKKFLATLATAAFVVTASTSAFAAANPFSDIPFGHWAYNSVAEMALAGIVEGYDDATYRGDRNITRSEMAKMSANLLLKLSPKSTAEAQQLIAELSGDKPATRYEIALTAAKIYTKVHKGNPPAATENFKDVPENHFASKAVNLMRTTKIMEGYSDKTFRGDRNMTRYEAAAIIARLYKKLSD